MHRHGHFADCTSTSLTECWCEVKRYAYILGITLIILTIQIGGGTLFRSVALYADSAHVAFDALAAIISIHVAVLVRNGLEKTGTRKKYMRMSAALLLVSLGWISYEAIERLVEPAVVVGWGMFATAFVGGAGNVAQHRLILHGEGHDTTHAMRLHIEGDLYSSVAVVVGGIAVWVSGWNIIDPLCSLGVVAWIGYQTVLLLLGKGHEHHHHH